MKKLVLATFLLGGFLYATDYTTLSTEELVSLRGTVPTEDKEAFKAVMQDRASTMSYDEKVAMGIPQQRSGSANANGTATRQRLQDGSGTGSMYRGSNSGGKGRR